MMRPYITPPNTRLYAIGDLHGYREPLARMMALIEEDARGRDINHVKVIFLGDYIDRGPDSAGVLDDLIALKEKDSPFEFVFLKGNHDIGMLGFLRDPEAYDDWLEFGGEQTLASYGVLPDKKKYLEEQAHSLSAAFNGVVPERHVAFLNSLSLYYQCGGFLFVHAGVRPNFSLAEQQEKEMTLIRRGFLDYEGLHPWRVVHGHTITKAPEILPNRINVDTGLYKYGVLSCAVIENDHVGILQVKL